MQRLGGRGCGGTGMAGRVAGIMVGGPRDEAGILGQRCYP